jgi:hypothetical protein
VRILYANVIAQHAGWGAEEFVDRGLRRLGHVTCCVDYRNHRGALAALPAQAPEYDIFFLQRGDGFPLEVVRALHGPRVFWASELVSRCRDQDPLLASGLFDHVFFHSSACCKTAIERGWVRPDQGSVLLNGFDETLHCPGPGVVQDIDILFCGSLTSRRQEWLTMLQGRFNVVTASAFGQPLVELVRRSKIVLNVHAEDFADVETRVFEVLGCGTLLLSERLSAESPFVAERPGVAGHLVEFSTAAELRGKTAYYLAHDAERRAIAERGHDEALLGHTYTHRARQVASVMGRLFAQAGRVSPYQPVPPNILSGSFRSEPIAPSSLHSPAVTGPPVSATSSGPPGQDAWTVERAAVAAYLNVCERASNGPPFGDFKRDPAYCRILEHVSEAQGRTYLEAILASDPDWELHFPRFAENDRLGNPQVFAYGHWLFSPTTLRYIWVLADLVRQFGSLDDLDIVEIGGGYGGQCKIIAGASRFRSYTLVDLPAAARLQQAYLAALNVEGFACSTPDDLPDRQYDLAISNFAVSELDPAGQAYYLERLLRRSHRGYLTWNGANLPDLSSLSASTRIRAEEPPTGTGNHIITWGLNALKPCLGQPPQAA